MSASGHPINLTDSPPTGGRGKGLWAIAEAEDSFGLRGHCLVATHLVSFISRGFLSARSKVARNGRDRLYLDSVKLRFCCPCGWAHAALGPRHITAQREERMD